MHPGQTRSRLRLLLLCAAAPLLVAGSCGDDDEWLIPEPEIVDSRAGVLAITLTQAPSRVVVAGRTFVSNVFNGSYIPPVLRMQRGDRLELELVNRIGRADVQIDGPQPTNLHYHGMVVPPVAPGDDVFLNIGPGTSYAYRWQVPADHAQGSHWYHPHSHGLVEPQILSGMSGMLVIAGLIAQHYPAYLGLVERHLLLKDIDLPGAEDGAPKTKTINAVLGGTLRMQPNEMQVWNLGNLGADAYFDLAVDGAQLWEINRDGNVLLQPKQLTSVFLPPGSRSTVVVVAPATPGRYAVRTLEVDTGPQGDPNPEVQLATLAVTGNALDTAALQARLLLPADDPGGVNPTPAQVAALPITRQRTVRFSETDDGNTFFIDGREYDESRDDVVVTLGDVEEWTILNLSGERHVFHIHQLDFLVTEVNGQPVPRDSLNDVVDLPYADNNGPGVVKVIIPFTNKIMVGRFVFHCHIVEHEDGGMMANLVVQAPGQPAMAPARMRTVSAPKSGLEQWLARLTGRDKVADPDDAICRTPAAPTPRQRTLRVEAARTPLTGAKPPPLIGTALPSPRPLLR